MNENGKRIFMETLITGDFSSAIERSEKREQSNIVRNQRLPIKSNDFITPREIRMTGIDDDMTWEERLEIKKENNKKWTIKQYETMGIIIVDEYDDLFFNVEIPNGWEIKPTDHSMWNEVFDSKGRKRISFFYKGAFYDRDAFSNFEKRYTYSEQPFDDYLTDATYEERKLKPWYGKVYDCGKEIFVTDGRIKIGFEDTGLNKVCKEYLDNNFPEWDDINAYWD